MDLNKRFELFAINLEKEVSSLAMLANQEDVLCLLSASEDSSTSIKFYEDKITLNFTMLNSQN